MDTAAANPTVKPAEHEPGSADTPTRIHHPFTNGVLKRHAPPQPSLHPPVIVAYRECLKNHAAALGGHAVDGCGEFMPSPASNPADPTSLRCAACGCHRNFHRREPEEPLPALEYRPHHRHHPPPPAPSRSGGSSPNDSPSSPPPISSSYYRTPLLALSRPHPDANPQITNPNFGRLSNSGGRKRFRTKFTQNQKDRMLELAESVGWRMQKRDEDRINDSCAEIGVDRSVFKVWMHNNKNTFGKKDSQSAVSSPPPPLVQVNGIGGSDYLREEEEDMSDSKLKKEADEAAAICLCNLD